MRIAAALVGVLMIGLVMVDVFNTIILARRTRNSFRITRAFYMLSWGPFAAIARRIRSSRTREGWLGIYGPLSLVLVLCLWIVALIFSFGLVQWAAGFQPSTMPGSIQNIFYLSGTTLLSLETGTPKNTISRVITVCEGGVGFGLLGLLVGYLPVFYQAFAKREKQISMLDARAGSPPSAISLLRVEVSNPGRIERYMEVWESWAAEILETQLSFPMMAFFRSHYPNQSWLTALTAMTDCAAVLSLCAEGDLKIQAEFTYAMCRHALSDVAAIFRLEPTPPAQPRLDDAAFAELKDVLENSYAPLKPELLAKSKLTDLRGMYEPQAEALSQFLLMALPDWHCTQDTSENWKSPRKPGDEIPFAVSDPFSRSR